MAKFTFVAVALLGAVFLATEAMTADRVKRQVVSTTCGCGAQVTFLVLNQTYTLSTATSNDISAILYVKQVLNYQNYQLQDIQTAITSAFANTVAPVTASKLKIVVS